MEHSENSHLREQAAVLTLVAATEREWYMTAALISQAGSAIRLLEGDWRTPDESIRAGDLVRRVKPGDLDRYVEMIEGQRAKAVHLTTVLDNDYPENLRLIYNKPPFLFIKGSLLSTDSKAIAIVGTRKASEDGLLRARRLARELATRGVTVLSGLALGIDTAAHTATLDACGRTVAVIGTGIERVYPRENEALAKLIEERGAIVSQFWPEAPPTKYSFPMRNVVMSGMSVGSVVIEASYTSGAKMQARLALDHGKRLFLVRSLVMQEAWAQRYSDRPDVTIVDSIEDVVRALEENDREGVRARGSDHRPDGQLDLFK